MNLAKIFQELIRLYSIALIQNDRSDWPVHTGEEPQIEITREENLFTITITVDGDPYLYSLEHFGLSMSLNVHSPNIHALICNITDRDAAAELYYRVMQGLIDEEINLLMGESVRLTQEQTAPWPHPTR